MTEARSREEHRASFTRLLGHQLVSARHDTSREAPEALTDAIVDLHLRIAG
ncbi:hypothetical protein [Streptomyces sp. NBC_01296]|uniref:hypothetical protein n=1 Tax=Streptomyces sp. NBC_01296 TaxID=2903816 RepID=UPI002E124790|nr:hypothetical protein OG299_37710 [Streptomyces sp. NBC_01296]